MVGMRHTSLSSWRYRTTPPRYALSEMPFFGRVTWVFLECESCSPFPLPAYAAIGDWYAAKREPDHVISRRPSAKPNKSQEKSSKGLYSSVFAAPSYAISDKLISSDGIGDVTEESVLK